jgi:hypothetical protein
MMGSTQYTFEGVDQMPDFWALSDRQLARSCVRIAQGWVPGLRPFLRAEALRLFLLWRESLDAARRKVDESEHQAAELAALRKRTIQVLVRISVQGSGGIPIAPGRP